MSEGVPRGHKFFTDFEGRGAIVVAYERGTELPYVVMLCTFHNKKALARYTLPTEAAQKAKEYTRQLNEGKRVRAEIITVL